VASAWTAAPSVETAVCQAGTTLWALPREVLAQETLWRCLRQLMNLGCIAVAGMQGAPASGACA
jgi:hypothetical protein